jgi:hypothetical protein
MKPSLVFKSLLLASLITACGESNIKDPSTFYNTGSVLFEHQVSNITADEIEADMELYVTAGALRVRSTPSIENDLNILGELKRNDMVKIIGEPGELFVEIQIIDSDSEINRSEKYFTAYKYLSKKSQAPVAQELSEYFMIQNLATEKLRVYKKGCESGDCPHQMLFEADIAVGEDKSGTRSVLGHFKITSWHKFYQDGAGNYPSWYDPNYPRIPGPGSSAMDWTSSRVLPYSSASVRGAFGWYTAKVGPDSSYQWTHGTIGWGADKKEFIEATRGFWANLFADPRSHGCTRTDNESIAYIRQLLPVGSTLIKVYAREAIADTNFTRYNENERKKWDYILTKNGVRVDGQKADRDEVLSAGTPASRYLEEGTLSVDTFPTPELFLAGSSGATKGTNGNYYALNHNDMTGVFLIDEGRLVNYKHPSTKLRVGGFKQVLFPEGIFADSNYDYKLPECGRRYSPVSKKQYRRLNSSQRRTSGRCAPVLDQFGKVIVNDNYYYPSKYL